MTARTRTCAPTIVGLLNTLLVAIMGCITCTLIGVTVGVLRLSKNWIVQKLATVYVEAFRNVPVLLWIVLTMGVMIKVPPQPSDFRGDNATASMILNDSVAVTNRGIYIPRIIYDTGSWVVVVALLLSIVGIFVFRRIARKRQEATGQILPVLWVSLALLFIPAIIAQFAMGSPVSLQYPELRGFNFNDGVAPAKLVDRTVDRAVALYRGLRRGERARGYSVGQQGSDRGRRLARYSSEPDHEPGDPAAGDARDRAADDLATT